MLPRNDNGNVIASEERAKQSLSHYHYPYNETASYLAVTIVTSLRERYERSNLVVVSLCFNETASLPRSDNGNVIANVVKQSSCCFFML